MAARSPLVIINGQVQQLPAGDTLVGGGAAADPVQGSYAPGSFTVLTGDYALMTKRLTLTGAQRVTLEGDARLRID